MQVVGEGRSGILPLGVEKGAYKKREGSERLNPQE